MERNIENHIKMCSLWRVWTIQGTQFPFLFIFHKFSFPPIFLEAKEILWKEKEYIIELATAEWNRNFSYPIKKQIPYINPNEKTCWKITSEKKNDRIRNLHYIIKREPKSWGNERKQHLVKHHAKKKKFPSIHIEPCLHITIILVSQ